MVSGNMYVTRCRTFYDGKQLSALDPTGVARTELALPRDGVLAFRIPETVNVDNDALVEVRDGDRSVLMEKFGTITVKTLKEVYPTVTVSGKFSPINKADIYPTSVEFTTGATGQKFSAVVTNGQYSIQLPNRETYQANVCWTAVPGTKTGFSPAGTLNLNANEQSYSFDARW